MMSPSGLLTLEEAQARLLALAEPLSTEHVDIEGSLGRYLAAPLAARRTQPAADMSAMDGYAVTDDDLAGPWRVVGESAAGHPFGAAVSAGQAVRISTGALLPEGTGSVILQEDLTREGDRLHLSGEPPVPEDKHIRRCGLDFREGAQVLPAGIRIGPSQAALAISAGHKHLPVRRLVKVAVIDSGDELAADPELCQIHQIPASNGRMLAAMARALPCHVRNFGPVGDSIDVLLAAFAKAADADVIVTSGGASVGDHDLIRPALEAWGAKLDFWKVAIKPGKPILVATREGTQGRQIVVGLPGNPVSSHVTAYHFLLPLLRSMSGAADPVSRRVRVRAGTPLRANGARREFLRAFWDGEFAVPHTVQDSGALASLAASNVLIDRPSHAPGVERGEEVWAFLLENGGIA